MNKQPAMSMNEDHGSHFDIKPNPKQSMAHNKARISK